MMTAQSKPAGSAAGDDRFVPRPVEGYREQGAQAWLKGAQMNANPHCDGTLASADWRLGFAGEAQLAFSGDAWSDEALQLDDEELHARADRSFILSRARFALPSAEEAAAAIGLPVEQWPLKCHYVATRIVAAGVLHALEVEHGPARVCYGIYEGPIDARSAFGRRPIARHGWIEFGSGLAVDPTRWVFEASRPYLWVGSIDEYDFGANRLRGSGGRPPPAHDPGDVQIRLTANDTSLVALIGDLLRDGSRLAFEGQVSRGQAAWLANLPPEIIGDRTPEVFRELDRMGCGAFIPVDNRQHAMAA